MSLSQWRVANLPPQIKFALHLGQKLLNIVRLTNILTFVDGQNPMKALQRIIYVDDEDYIRELVQLALEDDFQINAFGGGTELLQALPMELPDLLLLDVVMPVMDGPTILQTLRQQPDFSAIPAIFMTGETRPEKVQMLLDTGAIGVLAKPVDITTLADEIRALWAKAQLS